MTSQRTVGWKPGQAPGTFWLTGGRSGEFTSGLLTCAVKVNGQWIAANETDGVEPVPTDGGLEIRCAGIPGVETFSLVVASAPGDSRSLSLSASVRASEAIRLGGARLIEPVGSDGWNLPGGRDSWVLYGDGWRSNAVGSLVPLSDSSLDDYGADEVKACWVSSLQSPERNEGLIALAETAEVWPTWFEWTLNEARRPSLTIRAGGGRDFEEITLEPGRTKTTDAVVVTYFQGADPVYELRSFTREIYEEPVRLQRRVNHTSRSTPMGWSSWSPYFRNISEENILSTARFMRDHLAHLGYTMVLVDGGWWPHAGEFETNDAFPHGIRRLSDRVHEMGLKFGLHMSPFRVADDSPFWEAHSDWRLHKYHEDGKPTIDASHPDVLGWLAAHYQRFAGEWNVDLFKFDFLEWGGHEGRRHTPGLTGLEAYNRAVRTIRASVPDDVMILGCNGMTLPAVESFGSLRLGPDINRHAFPTIAPEYSPVDWGSPERRVEDEYEWPIEEKRYFISISGTARSVARQYWVAPSLATPDADSPLVNPNLTLDEARAHFTLVALTGGVLLLGDVLQSLPADRLELLTNEHVLAIWSRGRQAVPVDLFAGEEIPRVWILDSDTASVVAIFNWSDHERPASLDPRHLGLQHDVTFEATELWTSQRFRIGPGERPHLQPPHSVLLLTINSNPEVP